ncbi:hypothetical protein C8J57DRAFT_1626169 [Mycena rebaudengoi]|nr:hypothetical protein C8J57DRAFT_1626169 [Mycena rebaudengoi]
MSYSALLPYVSSSMLPPSSSYTPSHTLLVPPCPPPLLPSLSHPPYYPRPDLFLYPAHPPASALPLFLRTNTKHPPQNDESAQEETVRNQALIQELIARTSRRRFRISSFFDGGVWWGRGVRVGASASRLGGVRSAPPHVALCRGAPRRFLRGGYTPTGPVSGVLCAPPWAAALRALFRAVICTVAPPRVVSYEAGIHRRVPLLPFFPRHARVVPAPSRVALCHGGPRRFLRRRYVYAAARFRSVGAMCGVTVGCVGETDVHRRRGRGDVRTVPRGICTACVPRVWRRCGLQAARRVVDERDVCGRRGRGDARALSLRAPACDGPAPSHPRFLWVPAGRVRRQAEGMRRAFTLRASGGTRRALRDSVWMCVPWAAWRLAQRYAPRVARTASSGWPAVRFCALRAVGSVVHADGAGKREHAGVDMRAMRGVVIGGDDVDVLLRGVAAGTACGQAGARAARRKERIRQAVSTVW